VELEVGNPLGVTVTDDVDVKLDVALEVELEEKVGSALKLEENEGDEDAVNDAIGV
jgi:hypothetical protein